MSRQARRMLFCAFTILFVAGGIIAIFYSNGWRLDLETLQINKLGALFLEITPNDSIITVDKVNFEFKSGLLRTGTLIANLFPKTYTVKVAKSGYQTWTKQITVQPSLVAQIPPVLLLPEEPRLEKPIKKGISDFWLNSEKLITLNDSGILEFESKKIAGNSVHRWSSDGESVITRSDSTYLFVDLRKPQGALNLNLIFNDLRKKVLAEDATAIKNIDFAPAGKNQFIVSVQKGLYLLDVYKPAIKTLHQKAAEDFIISGNKIIFASDGKIWQYDPFLNTKEIIIDKKFQEIQTLRISPSEYHIAILESKGTLYIFNKKSLILNQVAENATMALFSTDSKKLAYMTDDKKLKVYFLADESKTPNQYEKTASFNLGSIEKETISWHKNSAYLFVKYPSSLYLLEANGLPPINFQMVDLENKKYYYEPDKNIVYLLKGNALYSLDLK